MAKFLIQELSKSAVDSAICCAVAMPWRESTVKIGKVNGWKVLKDRRGVLKLDKRDTEGRDERPLECHESCKFLTEAAFFSIALLELGRVCLEGIRGGTLRHSLKWSELAQKAAQFTELKSSDLRVDLPFSL
jgi:hypothetical protein